MYLINLLKKFYWRDYGFYTQSSIFQHTLKMPLRKLELKFAWGDKDYHLFYLHDRS